jgi:Ca2+/H+ antiporter, TMEM165/GDT1 family
MKKKWIVLAPLMILLFVTVGGTAVLLLWNWLLPSLFGWHSITFWQAIGLLALSRILFGGLGRHGWRGSGFRGRWAERWDRMTPEEREKFKEGMSPR